MKPNIEFSTRPASEMPYTDLRRNGSFLQIHAGVLQRFVRRFSSICSAMTLLQKTLLLKLSSIFKTLFP